MRPGWWMDKVRDREKFCCYFDTIWFQRDPNPISSQSLSYCVARCTDDGLYYIDSSRTPVDDARCRRTPQKTLKGAMLLAESLNALDPEGLALGEPHLEKLR